MPKPKRHPRAVPAPVLGEEAEWARLVAAWDGNPGTWTPLYREHVGPGTTGPRGLWVAWCLRRRRVLRERSRLERL